MSPDACLFALFSSALASASGVSPLMALPRLTASLPVIFALSASNPPGMLRFFATCAAATHWPRFLNPLHAVAASWPVSVLILSTMTVLWLNTVAGEACDISLFAVLAAGDPLMPGPCAELAPPAPAGGPPPGLGCER